MYLYSRLDLRAAAQYLAYLAFTTNMHQEAKSNSLAGTTFSAKRSQSDIQEIFSNNSDEPLKGFEVLEAEAVTRHATEDIHTPDLSTLQGDAGAIILAHGGGAQAGSSSAEAVAKAVADFRKKTKLPMQFRKIVFDVCNMASPSRRSLPTRASSPE